MTGSLGCRVVSDTGRWHWILWVPCFLMHPAEAPEARPAPWTRLYLWSFSRKFCDTAGRTVLTGSAAVIHQCCSRQLSEVDTVRRREALSNNMMHMGLVTWLSHCRFIKKKLLLIWSHFFFSVAFDWFTLWLIHIDPEQCNSDGCRLLRSDICSFLLTSAGEI